jgi:hypothetical protein
MTGKRLWAEAMISPRNSLGSLGGFDRDHLGARDHDLVRAHVDDLHGAFDDAHGVGIDDVLGLGVPQDFQHVLNGLRPAGEGL